MKVDRFDTACVQYGGKDKQRVEVLEKCPVKVHELEPFIVLAYHPMFSPRLADGFMLMASTYPPAPVVSTYSVRLVLVPPRLVMHAQ